MIAQGPLSRLYTTPISSHSIVAWHLISGAAILAAETALAAWLYNTLFHVGWPIWGPALYAAAAWSAFQILLCVSNQQSFPGFCVACAPTILLNLWLHSRYGGWFSMPTRYWTEVHASEILTLVVTIVFSYCVTTVGVSRARCGERIPSLGIWNWLTRQLEMLAISRKEPSRFRTAIEAQFWYEWRLKGLVLPCLTSVVLLIVALSGLASWFRDQHSLVPFYEVVLFLGGFISLLAILAGLFLGLEVNVAQGGQRKSQIGDTIADHQFESMGSFLGSRPIDSFEFARAILRTAAQSGSIAWLIWFTGFCVYLLIMWNNEQFPRSFAPEKIGVVYFPLTILGIWIALTHMAIIGLTGRCTKFLFPIIGLFIGFLLLQGMIQKFIGDSALVAFQSACLLGGSTLIVFAAIWAYYQAMRCGHLSSRALMRAAAVSFGIALGAILLLPSKLDWVAYPTIGTIAALAVMPVALMPLAIAWNRHR